MSAIPKKQRVRPVISKIHKNDETEVNVLRNRIDIAIAIVVTATAILISRLWFLQIYHGNEYAELSKNNRIRNQRIVAPRGNILDRNNRLVISTRPSFDVVWTREDAPHPDEVVKKLAEILNLDIADILARIRAAASAPPYIPISLAEDIDWNTLVYIENHRFDLPGIKIEALPRRSYLYNDSFSHLIGYLGEIDRDSLRLKQDYIYQGGDMVGKTGVEKLYEADLRGEKGRRLVEVDARGFEQQQLARQEPIPGNDLQLTIDIDMQQVAEAAMLNTAGAVVAMDVNSGRILTFVSSPALKSEEFIGGISYKAWQEMLNDPLRPLTNKPIQGQYPPGSTYKIVTALAGLSEGVINADTVFYCSGAMQFGNRQFRCWKKGGHGAVNLKRALTESCDVYFYHTGQKVGVDRLAKYAESLGLGQKTGINMEHEQAGLIPTSAWKKTKYKESWHEGETLSIAIGQGYDSTTPLQICQMTAAIANGGTRYQPQYIEMVKGSDGKAIKNFSPMVSGRVLGSPKAFALIKEGLVGAVNEPHGTASKARLKEIVVAGKTGTSQVIRLSVYKNVAEDKIPYKYRDHAWFTCFAPAEKPEIAVTVLVEHGAHGGSAAAPVAREVLAKYFDLKTAQIETEETDAAD